jgi:hypothetical protein
VRITVPSRLPSPWFRELSLSGVGGTVNLEVFSLAYLSDCLAALRDSGLLPPLRPDRDRPAGSN